MLFFWDRELNAAAINRRAPRAINPNPTPAKMIVKQSSRPPIRKVQPRIFSTRHLHAG